MKIEQRTCKYIIKTKYNIYDEVSCSYLTIETIGDKINLNTDKVFLCTYQLKQTMNGVKLR